MICAVQILECESEWGTRLDGTVYCRDKESAFEFVRRFNSVNNEKNVPDWYMRTGEITEYADEEKSKYFAENPEAKWMPHNYILPAEKQARTVIGLVEGKVVTKVLQDGEETKKNCDGDYPIYGDAKVVEIHSSEGGYGVSLSGDVSNLQKFVFV